MNYRLIGNNFNEEYDSDSDNEYDSDYDSESEEERKLDYFNIVHPYSLIIISILLVIVYNIIEIKKQVENIFD